MRGTRMFWLAGPLVVRDLFLGSSGLVVTVVAFVAGCALASIGSLVWFGYFGLLAALSLASCLPQLRRIWRISRELARKDDDTHTVPLAA